MQFAKKKVEKPTDNPWKTLGSKEIYNNPWIQIRQDDIINPAGNAGIYGVVSFKNKAIGIIPVDEEGYIYLVGQYRYTLNEYSWEIPEGGGPMNEAPLEAAKRELKEELGIEAETECIATIPCTEATGWEFVELHRALHNGPMRFAPDEIVTGAFFRLEDVKAWIAARPEDFASGFRECFKALKH